MLSSKKDSPDNKWRDETSFSTQLDYIKYIQGQPFSVQLLMAEANLPVAQRLVASYYFDKKDFKAHLFWIKKSADNSDPMSLIMLADYHVAKNELDEAMTCADKAMVAAKNLTDKNYLEHINSVLTDTLFNIGLKSTQANAVDRAKKAWEKAVTFNCTASALNLIQLNIEANNFKEALFYTDLALYFSKDYSKPEQQKEYRSECHMLRGIIKFEVLGEKVPYSDLLDVVSEFQKSIAYKKNERNTANLEQVLNGVSAENKSSLMEASQTLAFENGTYKTVTEVLHSAGKNKEEVAQWIEYQDPRVASTPEPTTTSEVRLSLLLKDLGTFSLRDNPGPQTQDNDDQEKCSIM
ncbi:MAG: hypothetical protein P4L79_13810 [Legionella sp.]|uniref:hypothetical protein n=1 Tax=Legionella sp. TaxID=459 RepID=UPI002849F998|nr:hypothetical protein [Legionella sp.]